MIVKIEKIKGFFGTPVLEVAVEGWLEGLRLGLQDSFENPVSWDDEILIAKNSDGEVVGFLSFAVQEWNKLLLVRFGYVREPYRRHGIYNRLWKAVIREAKARKLTGIRGETFLANKIMRAVSVKQGRSEHKVVMHFKVK